MWSKPILAAVVLCAASSSAQALSLNFDDQGLTGPSTFAAAAPLTVMETIGGIDVTVSGGTVLTNTAFLPANQTSIYGTADFFSGGMNPITVTFSQAIQNFFLEVLNGNTVAVDYTVADNAGNTRTFNLAPNTQSGADTIGIAAVGTVVTIFAEAPPQGACCAFDFFIDNINFNENLPPELDGVIPAPAALPLLAGALGVVGALRLRRRT